MIAYFVLACGITWLLLSPLVLSHQGIVSFHLSPHWHFLGGLGPIAAAALVAHRTHNRAQGTQDPRDPQRSVNQWIVGFSHAIALASRVRGLGY